MKKGFWICAVLMALSLVSFWGCAAGEGRGTPGGGEQSADQASSGGTDWSKVRFASVGEVKREQALWAQNYLTLEPEGIEWDEETENLRSEMEPVCLGDKVYKLWFVDSSDPYEIRDCYLQILDGDSMETQLIRVDLGQAKLGGEEGDLRQLLGMQAVSGEEIALRVTNVNISRIEEDGWPVYEQLFNGIVYIRDGERTGQADLYPFFQEHDMAGDLGQTISLEWDCDGEGRIYVRRGTSSQAVKYLDIFDREGRLLTEHEFEEQESLTEPMRTPDGELIYPVFDNENRVTDLLWFEAGQNRVSSIAAVEGEFVGQLYGIQGDTVYYKSGLGLVRWDTVSGERQLVFRYDENGIEDGIGTALALREGEGPLVVFWMEDGTDWVVPLSQEPVQNAETVRVVSLVEEGHLRVQNSVPAADRLDPTRSYVYETRGKSDLEDYRDQILAQLVSGEGPDLMYVSLEDMEMLAGTGALADLTEYLSPELLDTLLPGARELGTVDGTLVGIPPGLQVWSMLVGKEVFEGDRWTLEEMVSLIENGSLNNRFLNRWHGEYWGALAVMNAVMDYSVEESFPIDWEQRESHFQDELYIRFLNAIGKDMSDFEFEGTAREAAGGGRTVLMVDFGSIDDLVAFAGEHGAEGSHYVGFPTEHGNGNYLIAPGVVVVNRSASDREAVSGYLEYLLGEEMQSLISFTASYMVPVTVLPAEDITIHTDSQGQPEYWWKGNKVMVFEDGTSSVDEANALLASCVPARELPQALFDILYEEQRDYVKSDRSAQEAARIIDNRVQLYLDENG